jgi:hypothetical protein
MHRFAPSALSASILAAAAALAAGCVASPDTATAGRALTCFHADHAVMCAPGPGTLGDAARIKVEDFYPSACFDGDADGDGVPDFLDLDFLGSPEAAEPVRDDARCPRCNRGPGTQNDFRLRVLGDAGELDRGKVYATDGAGRLTVPTPDGVLTVVVTAETRVDDGEPAPGAEIRAEGTIVAGELVATRLKLLCGAPAALPPAEVPPEAEPVEPEASEPIEL